MQRVASALFIAFILSSAAHSNSTRLDARQALEASLSTEHSTPNDEKTKGHALEQAPILVRVIETPTDVASARAREAKAERISEETLRAQERAADAAEKQVNATWWSTSASLLGVLLLLWTLYETRRTATAAANGFNLAHKEFFATHRPKMAIRRLSFEVSGGVPTRLKFAIHNTGDAQGTIVGVSMLVYLPNEDIDPRTRFAYPEMKMTSIQVESGAWADISNEIGQSGGADLSFRYGFGPKAQIFVGGYVIYTDPVGTKRQTAILREYNHDTKLFIAIDDSDYEYQD